MNTTPGVNKESLLAAIAAARAKIAADKAAAEPSFGAKKIEEARVAAQGTWNWNKEQQEAIDRFSHLAEDFCLIGAAGTGKTTTLRGGLKALLAANKLPMLEKPTKYLRQDSPGAVLVSYTRRAVRNIAKQMPEELKDNCITIHKLLEYVPEKFEVEDKDGNTKYSMRFVPSRNRANPLPANLRLIVVDEASMVGTEYIDLIIAALPNPANVRWVFLGDLNQLPPIYGNPILGKKLLTCPIVELTQVYRQALESPIIEVALAIKDNKIPAEIKAVTKEWTKETPRGKVTLRPWKQKLDMEDAQYAFLQVVRGWVKEDFLNFEEDIILCAWNKAFGTIEINKAIGTELARKHGRTVFEIIAGFEKKYLAVGDRILVDKRDAIVTKISRNLRYIGKQPQPASEHMDYWGFGSTGSAIVETNADIDALLDAFADASIEVEDRVHEASHAVHVKFIDEPDAGETILSKAAELNASELAYAMSVHKSQGSEWRRVFFISHDCHAKMLSRELVYTGFTRAREELYVVMAPMMITKAASRPRLKGDTLEQKLTHLRKKLKETEILTEMERARFANSRVKKTATTEDDDED